MFDNISSTNVQFQYIQYGTKVANPTQYYQLINLSKTCHEICILTTEETLHSVYNEMFSRGSI